MCVVLDKYQISQTESNAGMQTDNNVFIRLSTLSALKEEINPLWLQSSMHIKNLSFVSQYRSSLTTLSLTTQNFVFNDKLLSQIQ